LFFSLFFELPAILSPTERALFFYLREVSNAQQKLFVRKNATRFRKLISAIEVAENDCLAFLIFMCVKGKKPAG
jgi:hypothetical protein